VIKFQCGVAVKRSKFGESKELLMRKTFEVLNLALRSGLDYLCFDYEWKKYNLTCEDLATILEEIDSNDGKLTVIFTVASRANEFLIEGSGKANVDSLLQLLDSYPDLLALNLVAGNPAYLSEEERGRSGSRTLYILGAYVASHAPTNAKILVGTENVLKTAVKLAAEFGYIPFHLFSDKLSTELNYTFSRTSGVSACYVPYSCVLSEREVALKIWRYVLRRSSAWEMLRSQNIDPKILVTAFENGKHEKLSDHAWNAFVSVMRYFVIYGDDRAFDRELGDYISSGMRLVIGLPLGDFEKEVPQLARIMRRES